VRRLALLIALASIAGCAAPVTPSQVLRDPAAYDRQLVQVTGTVRSVGARSGMQTFKICDVRCILVGRLVAAPVTEGSTMTVSGRFRIARMAGALAGVANTLVVH